MSQLEINSVVIQSIKLDTKVGHLGKVASSMAKKVDGSHLQN